MQSGFFDSLRARYSSNIEPFFVGNKVPYARLTPSFESGYLNEKHMQTTCIDKSP